MSAVPVPVPVSRAAIEKAHMGYNHPFSTRQTVRRTAHEEANRGGVTGPIFRSFQAFFRGRIQPACGAVCCIVGDDGAGSCTDGHATKAVRRLGRALGLRHYPRQM